MAIPVLSATEMREIDRLTIDEIGIPGPVLMEQAGRACAEEVEALLGERHPARIAVVCGKGNNGGDGLVASRHLIHAGHLVDVILLADPKSLKGDAELNKDILSRLGHELQVCTKEEEISALDLGAYDAILDGIFGTGLSSEVRELQATAIRAINDARVPVVSVDLPSGLCSDTGSVLGAAVQATATVTFGAPKRGHLLNPGAGLVGDLTVVDIGFPPELFPAGPGSTWLMTEEDLDPYVQPRRSDAHKGHFGHLLVVAGSADKPGAAGLCCRAATRSGAGLVTLAAPPQVLDRVVVGAVEFMGEPIQGADALQHAAEGKQAVALGPGLGQDPATADLVERAISSVDLPMVIDADGLNLSVGRLDSIGRASAPRILTPHPGEMARLMDRSTAEIQADRLGCSRHLASSTGAVVVLKGSGTVVADPDGTAFLVPTGNPGMASGGSGDVLTGLIGSLLCQGLKPLEAACVGAYLHGAAGDLAAQRMGQRGQVASDLIDCLPLVLARLEGFRERDDESRG